MKRVILFFATAVVASAQWSAPPTSGYATINTFLSSLHSVQIVAGAPTALACTAGKDSAFDSVGLATYDCTVTGAPGTWLKRQSAISLTTSGSSGGATWNGTTLNIPQYAGGGSMAWPGAAGIAVYGGSSAWGTSLTAPTGAIVGAGQANTFTTGLQDFSAVTWKVPSGAGFTASASSMFGYDSTATSMHVWHGGADHAFGTAAFSDASAFQVTITGAPSTWPTLGTAAAHAATDFEAGLGNPGTSGYVLASTTGGVRSWVTPQSGPQGPQGIQGVQGATGSAGAAGAQGIQGPAGPSPTDSGNKVLATPANGSSGVMAPRTLVGADMPFPGSSSLGGVEAKDCSGTGLVQKINTDGTVSCAAGGGGSTRTWNYSFQGANYGGVPAFSANLPASSAPAATSVGGTDPAAVLEWPTGQSTYYAWWSFVLPTGYVSNAAISYSIESRSTDSTHAAILTPSWACVSTATVDAPSWTAVSTVNVTGTAASGRVVTTGTITPTCAAGNRTLVKLSIDTNTNSMTAGFDLIGVTFSLQGGL